MTSVLEVPAAALLVSDSSGGCWPPLSDGKQCELDSRPDLRAEVREQVHGTRGQEEREAREEAEDRC